MSGVGHEELARTSLLQPDDGRLVLPRRKWDVLKAIAVDCYYFHALIAFFVLVYPVVIACHYIDSRCGTRSTARIVRFCERF